MALFYSQTRRHMINDIFITDNNRQEEDDEQTNILIQIEGTQEGEGEGEGVEHGDQDEAGDLDLVARQQEEGEEDSGQGEDLETTGELW